MSYRRRLCQYNSVVLRSINTFTRQRAVQPLFQTELADNNANISRFLCEIFLVTLKSLRELSITMGTVPYFILYHRLWLNTMITRKKTSSYLSRVCQFNRTGKNNFLSTELSTKAHELNRHLI